MAHPCARQAKGGRQVARARYADGGEVKPPSGGSDGWVERGGSAAGQPYANEAEAIAKYRPRTGRVAPTPDPAPQPNDQPTPRN